MRGWDEGGTIRAGMWRWGKIDLVKNGSTGMAGAWNGRAMPCPPSISDIDRSHIFAPLSILISLGFPVVRLHHAPTLALKEGRRSCHNVTKTSGSRAWYGLGTPQESCRPWFD